MESVTVRHVGKLDGALDVLKGILAGTWEDIVLVGISHAEIEKKKALRTPKDNHRVAMGKSWCDVAAGTPRVRRAPLKCGAGCTVML